MYFWQQTTAPNASFPCHIYSWTNQNISGLLTTYVYQSGRTNKPNPGRLCSLRDAAPKPLFPTHARTSAQQPARLRCLYDAF